MKEKKNLSTLRCGRGHTEARDNVHPSKPPRNFFLLWITKTSTLPKCIKSGHMMTSYWICDKMIFVRHYHVHDEWAWYEVRSNGDLKQDLSGLRPSKIHTKTLVCDTLVGEARMGSTGQPYLSLPQGLQLGYGADGDRLNHDPALQLVWNMLEGEVSGQGLKVCQSGYQSHWR